MKWKLGEYRDLRNLLEVTVFWGPYYLLYIPFLVTELKLLSSNPVEGGKRWWKSINGASLEPQMGFSLALPQMGFSLAFHSRVQRPFSGRTSQSSKLDAGMAAFALLPSVSFTS